MLEFTDYGAIIPAMRLNNTDINGNEIKVSGCLSKGWLGIANLKKNYKDHLDLGQTWLK